MVGHRKVRIRTRRLDFQLDLKRKFTFIQGNSGTGKSVLRDLLDNSNGVIIESDSEITALVKQKSDYTYILEQARNRIFVVDEDVADIMTSQFVELLKRSDNYFVIITRECLPGIPFSVNECYKMETVNGIHRLVNLYTFDQDTISTSADIITEDERSGNEFFEGMLLCKARSFNGLGNIRKLREVVNDGDSIIVDGAAFGGYMQYVTNLGKQCKCYFPESFEYLLLKANVIDVEGINLDDVSNCCDNEIYDTRFVKDGYKRSEDLISWERFYYEYLKYLTFDNAKLRYSKSKLNPAYLSSRFYDGVSIIQVPCIGVKTSIYTDCAPLHIFT